MPAINKAEIPFALLLLPFLVGLCLAAYFPLAGRTELFFALFFVAMALFIGLNLAYQKLHIYKNRWLGGALVHVILLIAGIICFNNNREIDRDDHFSKLKSQYIIVTIASEPKLSGQNLHFTAKVEQVYQNNGLAPVSGHVLITLKTDSSHQPCLHYGDQLILPARFNEIEPPQNPAEFNYKSYMAHQNVYQQVYLNGKQVMVVGHAQGNALIGFAQRTRLALVGKLKTNMRDTDAIAVASTMLLGYRADLRKEVQQTYAQTGTMHLLSVAGMHVGLVYLFISFILSFLTKFKHGKLLKISLSIFLIWCYALITGFSPAVCRASLMLSAVIIGLGFSRHISRLNLLAVSAFILLLYNPFYLLDVGFQLSYIAVGGIIIIQPYIYKWLFFGNRWLNELWLVCSVSIAAQIVLFPIGMFYFHDFPVYFLVSNLFVVIPSAIILFVGIVYLALPVIPILSSALAWLVEHTALIMTKTLGFIEHAPFGRVDKLWLSPFEVMLCYGLIISVICLFIYKNKIWLKAGLSFALLIAIAVSVKQFSNISTNNITFYSVGKSTAILVQNGDSGVLLTDMKTTDKNFQYAVEPSLDSCGIGRLGFCPIHSNADNSLFKKNENLIQAGNKTILMINKAFTKKLFPEKLGLDYIYLSGSPKLDLQYLTKNYTFKMLIAGNNNSAYLVKKLEVEASAAKLPFLNLKRNKAFIISSN